MKATWIDYEGARRWYQDGRSHREEDLPAMIWPNGSRIWFWNGKIHRETAQALIWGDGTGFWYLNGQSLSQEEWKMRTGK